jgi:diguanylate cyclase (GGDEF)-like protein
MVLVVYSGIAGWLYTGSMPLLELVELMVVPALALGLVVLYNLYYSLNYRRLASLVVWNSVQLGLDTLVVTVLVHFSGGVNSWFWSIYALIIFEAAFILPRSRDVWAHALFSLALLGFVEFSESFGLLGHKVIPYATSDAYSDPVFVGVRYFWQVAVLLGSAWVATMLVGEFRRELESRRAHALVDEDTGLFSREYLMRALRNEVRRAQRDRRPLHIMFIDIDRFGEFNNRFGIDAGDRLIREFAVALNEVTGAGESEQPTTNVAARLGGEEFAILLAEIAPAGAAPSSEDAEHLANQMAKALSELRVDGAGVSVSVGVASMPQDGVSCSELLDAADGALAAAIEAGGNQVVVASSLRTAVHEDFAENES